MYALCEIICEMSALFRRSFCAPLACRSPVKLGLILTADNCWYICTPFRIQAEVTLWKAAYFMVIANVSNAKTAILQVPVHVDAKIIFLENIYIFPGINICSR